MVELIANVNNAINGFVWGVPMLVLLVGTGILMTILTKFFQLSHIGHWFKKYSRRHLSRPTRNKSTRMLMISPSPSSSRCAPHWLPPSVPVISSAWQVLWSPVVPAPSSGCGL